MLKQLILISLVIGLTGCSFFEPPAATSSTTDRYVKARKVVERPDLIRAPSSQSNYHLLYGNDPALESAFNKYISTGKAPNIMTDGFVKFAYNAGQQPIVKAAPFQETVISLQPGEKFTNISSGDPNRWSYAVAVSGSGSNQQQNILVKPSLPEISTNMVITTDKRMYNLRLMSTSDAQASRNVSFWYPEEMVEGVNSATLKEIDNSSISTVPDVNLKNINFNYDISSDSWFSAPSWKPTRVFDDGVHTYIQFPASMSNRDMPVLFILKGNKKELVNYRSKPPYFVVDKIFKKAMLVLGTDGDQTIVTITNRQYE